MRRLAWLFLLALPLTLACGEDGNPTGPSGTDGPPAPARVTVVGIVTSSFRDTPIANATVRVTGGQSTGGTSVTDDNGYFAVADVAVGAITIGISATGFADTSTTTEASNDRTHRFMLTPTTRAALFGVVRDGNGQPLSGVRVSASGGHTTLVRTTTDGSGFYHLAGIAPGRIATEWYRVDLGSRTEDIVFEYTDLRHDVTIWGRSTSADYTISGTARRCAVTYANSAGRMVDEDVAIPWSYHLTPSIGDTLLVRCRISTAGDTGTVTVGIRREGQTVNSATVTGYPNTAIATAVY